MATNSSCIVSLPSLFSTNSSRLSSSHPYLSIPAKPFKLNLACYQSYSSSSLLVSLFSLRKKKDSNFGAAFSAVAAQQEEDNTLVLEEEEEEGEGGEQDFDFEAGGSEFEVENSLEDPSGESEGGFEGLAEGEAEDNEEGEFQEPPEDAKLFVGNLPYDVDSERLAQLFEQAGVVEIAEVIYNRETDQSRGFGFVTMSSVEEAEKAVEMFHRYANLSGHKDLIPSSNLPLFLPSSNSCPIQFQALTLLKLRLLPSFLVELLRIPQLKDLNGRFLTVNKAAPRGSRPERTPRIFDPTPRIYVGNLPWDVDDARLEQVFSEHGKVINARVVTDRDSGRSRGFGFVTMSSESEMNDAIANLDGQSLDGRAIKVNVAEERPRRSF